MTRRDRTLRRKYGITEAQYDKMLALQGGGCAICGRKAKVRRLHTDHDHRTKAVRGALCMTCNRYRVAKNDAGSAWRVWKYLFYEFDARKLKP